MFTPTRTIFVLAILGLICLPATAQITVSPGETTVYDVELSLYPRVDIDQLGIAPLSSMSAPFFESTSCGISG